MTSKLRVLMLSSEYTLHRVGGLGAHVSCTCATYSQSAPFRFSCATIQWYRDRTTNPWANMGRVYRVDATKPTAGSDFDLQVWRMNDQLNTFITERIEQGTRYDVIHAHDWLTGYVANDLHRRYGIPLVVTIHATESGRLGGFIRSSALSERIHLAEQHLAMEAQKIIICSDFMCDEIERELNAPKDEDCCYPKWGGV